MRMESEYLVKAESSEAKERLMALWGKSEAFDESSFQGFGNNDIFGVMARVIKAVHQMKNSGRKDSFQIVGNCDTDYDCTAFAIEYSGDEPRVKVKVVDAEDEEEYRRLQYAGYDEITAFLEQEMFKTFREAIEEILPPGARLDMQWVASLIE